MQIDKLNLKFTKGAFALRFVKIAQKCVLLILLGSRTFEVLGVVF